MEAELLVLDLTSLFAPGCETVEAELLVLDLTSASAPETARVDAELFVLDLTSALAVVRSAEVGAGEAPLEVKALLAALDDADCSPSSSGCFASAAGLIALNADDSGDGGKGDDEDDAGSAPSDALLRAPAIPLSNCLIEARCPPRPVTGGGGGGISPVEVARGRALLALETEAAVFSGTRGGGKLGLGDGITFASLVSEV